MWAQSSKECSWMADNTVKRCFNFAIELKKDYWFLRIKIIEIKCLFYLVNEILIINKNYNRKFYWKVVKIKQ